jgi:hypothetical protein
LTRTAQISWERKREAEHSDNEARSNQTTKREGEIEVQGQKRKKERKERKIERKRVYYLHSV